MAAVSVKRSNGPLIMTVLEFFIVFNLFKATIKMVSSPCLLHILRLSEYEKKSAVFLTIFTLIFTLGIKHFVPQICPSMAVKE